jgi:serine/threonine protein phosphatase PrpC
VNGTASASIGQGGWRSTSTGQGSTACDGTGPCEAGVRITTSAAMSAPGVKEEDRFAATSVSVAASCDNGTKAGCAVRATSHSDVTGAAGVHAEATATCAGGAGCLVATSGTASPDLAQAAYQCVGSGGCTGHSEGTAEAGNASAGATSDCRAGGDGQCAGTTTVGASTDGSAMAGASCEGTAGAACRFHFEATASDSARDGSSSARAYAHGSQTGERGGGAVQVMATADAEGPAAQAQAMCQGTAGVKCGYQFEATASSSSRDGATWATAYAHGSQSGEMGGGAVQVMAQTYARGPDASAQAICRGAKNCTSTYAAHAEAHDRLNRQANPNQPDMPSGYWSADGSGTCRGSGKGGCGVHAWADAGPGGSGGARCSGDCSGFVQEQGGPSTFTKTGPSWNEMLAARRARQSRVVKNLDEVIAGLKPGDSFIGSRKGKDGYTIYTKEPGGEVVTRPCPASECKPGHTIKGGNGKITFPQQGNPQTTQQSAPGKDPHTCDASVGCALTNDGKGNGRYWIEGDGTVRDGITGSRIYFKNSKPAGSRTDSRNAGSFGNTKGAPFTFTCNGGCRGEVSNVDVGKGRFTDRIDLEGTPNLLVGRDGLGNLVNYAHHGKGTVTLQGRDGKMMDPISSTAKDGLTAERWSDVAAKYGYTPWDLDTISKVLGPGDSMIGFKDEGDGSYLIYTKEPDGTVGPPRKCYAAADCAAGKKVEGGRGSVSFPEQGDPTASQTSAPGQKNNTCTANVSCGLATDGNGNGMWWLEGNGQVHDGITGSDLMFKDSRPADGTTPNRNGGNFADTEGSPFTFTCNGGCKGEVSNIDLGKGRFTDHIDLEGTSNGLFGRDGFGNAGDFSHFGQGVVTLQVGKDGKDVITSNGDGRDADDWTTIITRNAATGAGGFYDVKGGQTYRITIAEGYGITQTDKNLLHSGVVPKSDAGTPGQVITPDAHGTGGRLECVGRCQLVEPWQARSPGAQPLTCAACRVQMDLGSGAGPRPAGYVEVTNFTDGRVTHITREGDEQLCVGNLCHFTQFLRDVNGNGGGATCSTGEHASGNTRGLCSGENREGDRVSCDGKHCRTGLLYRNADGSRVGQYCGAGGPYQVSCAGTDPTVSPDPDAFPVPADPNDAVNEIYDRTGQLTGRARSDSAALGILEDNSTRRRMAAKYPKLAPQITRLADLTEKAIADNRITDAEWRQIDPLRRQIEKAAPEFAEWGEATDRLERVPLANYVSPYIGAGAHEAAASTGLDMDTVKARQAALEDATRKLNAAHEAQTGSRTALKSQIDAYEAEVAAITARGGATPAEKKRLDRERQRLLARQVALDNGLRPAEQAVDVAKAGLRELDRIFAVASQHETLPGDLVAADAELDRIDALNQQLVTSKEKRQQQLANTFGAAEELAELSYSSVRDSVRDRPGAWDESLIPVLSLPSTMLPDVMFAQAAVASLPTMEQHYRDGGGSQVAHVWAELDRSERTNIAAYAKGSDGNFLPFSEAGTIDPALWEREFLSDADNVRYAIGLARQQAAAAEGKDVPSLEEAYQTWYTANYYKPDDWDTWTRYILTKEEKDRLEADHASARPDWWQASADNVSHFLSDGLELLRQANEFTSPGPETEVDLPVMRDVDGWLRRAGDDLGHLVTHSPSTLVMLGDHAVTEAITWGRIAPEAVTLDRNGLREVVDDRSASELFPFTAMPITAGANMVDRWGSAATGDWSKVAEGYGNRPFSTLVEDMVVPATVLGLGGVSATLRIRSNAALRNVAEWERQAGVPAGTAARLARGRAPLGQNLTEAQQALLTTAASHYRLGMRSHHLATLSAAPGAIVLAPVKPIFVAGRAVAGGVSRALGPVGRLAERGAAAAADRAARPGPVGGGWAAAAGGLRLTGGVVTRVATVAGEVGRSGLVGSVRVGLARHRLGVGPNTPIAEVHAAFERARAQVEGRGTVRGRSARLAAVDQAYQLALAATNAARARSSGPALPRSLTEAVELVHSRLQLGVTSRATPEQVIAAYSARVRSALEARQRSASHTLDELDAALQTLLRDRGTHDATAQRARQRLGVGTDATILEITAAYSARVVQVLDGLDGSATRAVAGLDTALRTLQRHQPGRSSSSEAATAGSGGRSVVAPVPGPGSTRGDQPRPADPPQPGAPGNDTLPPVGRAGSTAASGAGPRQPGAGDGPPAGPGPAPGPSGPRPNESSPPAEPGAARPAVRYEQPPGRGPPTSTPHTAPTGPTHTGPFRVIVSQDPYPFPIGIPGVHPSRSGETAGETTSSRTSSGAGEPPHTPGTGMRATAAQPPPHWAGTHRWSARFARWIATAAAVVTFAGQTLIGDVSAAGHHVSGPRTAHSAAARASNVEQTRPAFVGPSVHDMRIEQSGHRTGHVPQTASGTARAVVPSPGPAMAFTQRWQPQPEPSRPDVPSLVDVQVLDIRLIRAGGHVTREFFGERLYNLGRVRPVPAARLAAAINRMRDTKQRAESRYWADRAEELERQAERLRRENAGLLRRSAHPPRSREERRLQASWKVQAAKVEGELERLAVEAADARTRAEGQEDPRSAAIDRELAELRREERDVQRQLIDSQRELDRAGAQLDAQRRAHGERDGRRDRPGEKIKELRESRADQQTRLADLRTRIQQLGAEREQRNPHDPRLAAEAEHRARVAGIERRLAPLRKRMDALDRKIAAAFADPDGPRAPARLLRERAELEVRTARLRAAYDAHWARFRAGAFVTLRAEELIQRLESAAVPVPGVVIRDLRELFTADPSAALRAARVLLGAGRTSRGRAADMIAAVNEHFRFGWDESVQRALQDGVRQLRYAPHAARGTSASPARTGGTAEQPSEATPGSTQPARVGPVASGAAAGQGSRGPGRRVRVAAGVGGAALVLLGGGSGAVVVGWAAVTVAAAVVAGAVVAVAARRAWMPAWGRAPPADQPDRAAGALRAAMGSVITAVVAVAVERLAVAPASGGTAWLPYAATVAAGTAVLVLQFWDESARRDPANALRQLTATPTRRTRAWEAQVATWKAVEPVGPDASLQMTMLRLVLGSSVAPPAVRRTEWTIQQLRNGLRGLPAGWAWLGALAAEVARTPRVQVVEALDALVKAGVLVRQAGGAVRVPSLVELAPVTYVSAVARNAVEVLDVSTGAQVPAGSESDGLFVALSAGLRSAVEARAQADPGRRGRAAPGTSDRARRLRDMFAPAREDSRTVERLRRELEQLLRQVGTAERLRRLESASAEQWAARLGWSSLQRRMMRRGLPAELQKLSVQKLRRELLSQLRAVDARLGEAQGAEWLTVVVATNEAVVAGFSRRRVDAARDRAVLGAKRFMPRVVGFALGWPGQTAAAPTYAGLAFAEQYGRPGDDQWVTDQGKTGTFGATGVMWATSALGHRLIRNMVTIVGLGAVGTLGLTVMGVGGPAVAFVVASVMAGLMNIAGSLIRGRMDIYHPVLAADSVRRDNTVETFSKLSQLVAPLVIAQGIGVLAVPVTMYALAGATAVLTAVVWFVVRGENAGRTRAAAQAVLGRTGEEALPRAPPLWKLVTLPVWRTLLLIVGTPHGLMRWVLSPPLLVMLTGLPVVALGGVMVDSMVVISNPQQWLLSTDNGVTALLFVSRAGAVLSGRAWPWIERLARDRNGQISQSRLLLVVTLLPVPLLPAAWVVQALWPSLGVLLVPFTVAAVLTGWARTPVSVWTRGPVGASLNNTARIGAVPLAQLIDGLLIGGFADAIGRRVESGTDYSALVDTAIWRLVALSVPVAVVPLLVAVMIRRLRVAPLPDMQSALERAGGTPEQAAALIEHLSTVGIRDEGTLRAVLFDGWRPRIAPRLRLAARARLQHLLDLEPEQIDWLDAAQKPSAPPDQGTEPGPAGPLRALVRWATRAADTVAAAARSIRGTRSRDAPETTASGTAGRLADLPRRVAGRVRTHTGRVAVGGVLLGAGVGSASWRLGLDHRVAAVITFVIWGATAVLVWVINRNGPPGGASPGPGTSGPSPDPSGSAGDSTARSTPRAMPRRAGSLAVPLVVRTGSVALGALAGVVVGVVSLLAGAGPAAAGELAQDAAAAPPDVWRTVLVAGVRVAVVLWAVEAVVAWRIRKGSDSLRRSLLGIRAASAGVGGLLGLAVAAGYGRWIGPAVALVLVVPDLLALVFAVLPHFSGRQPVERLRKVEELWLKLGPPLSLRLGFLAGALWLLFLQFAEAVSGGASMALALAPAVAGRAVADRHPHQHGHHGPGALRWAARVGVVLSFAATVVLVTAAPALGATTSALAAGWTGVLVVGVGVGIAVGVAAWLAGERHRASAWIARFVWLAVVAGAAGAATGLLSLGTLVDQVWEQRSWVGLAGAMAAAVRGMRLLSQRWSGRRLDRIGSSRPMALGPREVAAADAWRLLAWLARHKAAFRNGLTARQLTYGATRLGVGRHSWPAEYVDRKMMFPGGPTMQGARPTGDAKALLRRLAALHRELGSAPSAQRPRLLTEAAETLAVLDEKLGATAAAQPGRVRGRSAGLWVGAVAGIGTGIGLILAGGGPVATATGLAIAAAGVLAAIRARWSPVRIRAPTRAGVAAAGRVVRAAITLFWWDTLTGLERVFGFRFADLGARIAHRYRGLPAQLSPSWWWFSVRVTADAVRTRTRAVVAGVRGRGVRLIGEHRYYPTWLQEMLERVHPGLGAWFYEFLHLKLRRQAPKGDARGLRARLTWFAQWLRGLPRRAAAMVYNRAFIVGHRTEHRLLVWETPVGGFALLVFRIVITVSDLGQLVVLDQQELGGRTTARSRTLGAFPVIRVAFHLAVPGLGRFDLSFVHFTVPGKKLDRTFDAPRQAGWQRFNLSRRFANWPRVHDLAFWTWKPFAFIAQTQIVVGIGPFGEDHYNYSEYRYSIQNLEERRNGKPVRGWHFIQGPARQMGRAVFALGRLVRRGAGALPGWVRGPARLLWGRVWRTSLGERRRAYIEGLRLRGLRLLDDTMHVQHNRLDRVETELADLEFQTAVRTFLHVRAIDPVVAWLYWRRERFRKVRAGLVAALDANHGQRAEIEEGPGSTLAPIDPPLRTRLVTVPPTTGRASVSSGILPATLQSTPNDTTQLRVGFDLGDLAGRTESGHPQNRNFDAMAAVRSADGRYVAVVADQQGAVDGSTTPVSQIAAAAAIRAALGTDPTTPADQVARIAYAAAVAAAAPAVTISTLALVVVAPTGPNTVQVAFAWVGDSRGYLVTPDSVEQVTSDHTWTVAQTVEAPPANEPIQYVTRWIGRGAGHRPDVRTRELAGPATIVLTTDELHDFYPDAVDLGDVVRAAPTPGRAADDLIDNILTRGSGNKTAVVINLDPSAPPAAPPARRSRSGPEER